MDTPMEREERYSIQTKYDTKTKLMVIRINDKITNLTYVYYEDEIFNLPEGLFDMQCYIYSVWDKVTTCHFNVRSFDPGYNYCRIVMVLPSEKNKYI